MTFVEFTSKFFQDKKPLLFILLAALILRIYKIEQAFPFDFDQQIPAEAAYNFFINHKITLIGQELSFKGFFLGSLHNWIQFIPYGICNLKPDCVPYFYILIGIITIIILYLVVKKIFDTKTAIISSSIYAISFSAISFERGVNSNYFLFLSSIGLLFCLYKYFSGENKFLIFGAFIAGLAVVNFNPVFIFSAMTFFLFALMRSKRGVHVFIIAGFAFLINYFPLVIFNFRHDNILWNNLLNFISQNTTKADYFSRFIFLVKNVSIPFYSYYLFQSGGLVFSFISLIIIAFGIYLVVRSKNIFYLFLPIWVIVVILGFVFYKGWVPDYYFQQALLPIIIFVSLVLRKNFVIFLLFTFVFLFMNIHRAINYNTVINYKIKKDAVNFIINDSKGETFNVYYQLPLAHSTGYSSLFKLFEKLPQEGGKNLYIFEFKNSPDYLKYIYQKSFPKNKVEVGFDHFVKIVSVKNVN